jgi:hypothetical protein
MQRQFGATMHKNIFLFTSIFLLSVTAKASVIPGRSWNSLGSSSTQTALKINVSQRGMVQIQLASPNPEGCLARFGAGVLHSGSGGSLVPSNYKTAVLPILEGCGGNRHSKSALLWINLNWDGSVGRSKLIENSSSRSNHTFWTNF